MTAFDQFKHELNQYYDFEVLYKNESKFMKFLSKILFFNNDFMVKYITTIGNKIYFPTKEWVDNHQIDAMDALAHELVHIKQGKKLGSVLFSFLYIFPQSLVIFSLLAVLGFVFPAFFWCLFFLLCALPLPAPFRKKFEYEGYVMTLFMFDQRLRLYGKNDEKIRKILRKLAGLIKGKIFRKNAYYFMWPLKLPISFDKPIEDIRTGVISDTEEMYVRIQRAYVSAVSAYE